MRRLILFLALVLAPCSGLFGGELPLPTAAKLLQIISKGGGEGGRIATKNAEMIAELGKISSEINLSGKIAWATTPEDVRLFSMQRKCVVTNDPKFINQGAALAIYEDGGRVKIAINQKAVQTSGVALSDAILKAAMQ